MQGSAIKMSKLWGSKHLTQTVKLRLFEAAVVSVSRLLCGSEAWVLDQQARSSLRGCMVCSMPNRGTHVTGRSIKEETIDPTFELLGRIRARRLKWLGEVIRNSNEEMLVRRVALGQCR